MKDHPIFLESIKYIRNHLEDNAFNHLENKVLERLVHTSGDFKIQNLLEFSKDACQIGIKSRKNGVPILTDTDMSEAAIKTMAENTTGNKIFSASNWSEEATDSRLTKTAYGLSEGWLELSSINLGTKSPIVVIGSSPTALINLLDILEDSKKFPSLIIGMPVGFIGVEKSKQKLIGSDLSRIVINSTRGGAAMAAATINALLRECI